MSEPKDFVAVVDSDARKTPRRIAFITKRTSPQVRVKDEERVMTYPVFADCAPDFRRWTVKVTDEVQRPVMNVIFPVNFMPGERKPIASRDARTLLLTIDRALKASASAGVLPRNTFPSKISRIGLPI